jgi:hypothetical protein
MSEGWVKLHRKLLDSPVWQLQPSQLKVFICCLLRANHQDAKWFNGAEEVVVSRGSFITSHAKLMELTGLRRQAVRGSLRTLEKTTTIATKTATKQYTVISIVNFDAYQDALIEATKPTTQPATKRQPSGNHKQECKNKRTITEPLNGSAHKEVLDHYHRMFEGKFGAAPLIIGGRDGKIVHDILRARKDPEEVKGLIGLFFQVGTKYSRDNGKYDLPAFKASFNELLVLSSRRSG